MSTFSDVYTFLSLFSFSSMNSEEVQIKDRGSCAIENRRMKKLREEAEGKMILYEEGRTLKTNF